MDAVQRLLLLAAQRRGVLTVDLGMASDVAMTFRVRTDAPPRSDDQLVVCEADVEGCADKLASMITGERGASGRRP